MSELHPAPEFSLDDLRRDVCNACLKGPAPRQFEMLDPYGFIAQPAIVRRLGLWISARLDARSDRLVGVGASALPIALAVGLELSVPVAFVASGSVHGALPPGDRVAVVADIVRTGDSTIATVDATVAAGAEATQLFVVWDRAQGAADRFRRLDIPLHLLIEDRS